MGTLSDGRRHPTAKKPAEIAHEEFLPAPLADAPCAPPEPETVPWPRRGKALEGTITAGPPGHARADAAVLPFGILDWSLATTAALIEDIRRARDAQRWPELMPGHGYSGDTGEFTAICAPRDGE